MTLPTLSKGAQSVPIPTARHRVAAATIANASWIRSLALLAIIALLVWSGFTQLRTPGVQPATAPASSFSAERAMVHLNVIAQSSRAVGLPGHDAARDYLVAQLTTMGLQPQIQTTTSVLRFDGADAFGAGTVSNIVARIPGTASTGAIAINAHYDGGATGPAAGDNGVGVVAALEVARAVLAGPPLANDLILVFSDAEENGDLGAAAFNQLHPWAKDVRLAINSEAQGTGGPAMLYATSDQNGWLTGQYLAVAPEPSAYSLLPEIVRAMAGSRLACDLQDYIDRGAAGLGFVIVNDVSSYHTATDAVANIDQGSLQQEGDNTLAAVRRFGGLNLTTVPTSTNRVYFTVLPGVVFAYSGDWAIALAAVTTLLVLLGAALAIRRGLASIGGLAVGIAALLLGALATTILTAALWFAVKATNADLRVLLVGPYRTNVLVAGLSLIALALMAGLYTLLLTRVRAENLLIGAMLAWTLLLWATTFAAPGASYYLLWPLLFAALPLAWTLFVRGRHPGWQLAVLAIATLPAAFLVPGLAYQLVGLLTRLEYLTGLTGTALPLLGLWAFLIVPLVGLAIQQVNLLAGGPTRPYRWLVPGLAVAVGALLIGWGSATSGFDAQHPRPDNIAYELNADTGAARFVSLDASLDSFTKQFFPGRPGRADFELAPGTNTSAFAAPAPMVALEGAAVAATSDATVNGARTVTFRITSPRRAPQIDAVITAGGAITAASINGRALDLSGYAPARDGKWQFGYTGIGAGGIEVTLTVQSTASINVGLVETSYGLPTLPGLAVHPRTDAQMPAPGLALDATILRRTFNL